MLLKAHNGKAVRPAGVTSTSALLFLMYVGMEKALACRYSPVITNDIGDSFGYTWCVYT